MPGVYRDKRHYYFGEPSSLSRRDFGSGIAPFMDFWSKARTGDIARIHVQMGGACDGGFIAPIACYRYRTSWDNRETYLLIQHGSYLDFDVAEQPLIKDGLLLLFRGIGMKRTFYWRTLEDLSPDDNRILQRYFDAHQKAFSDAEASFQIAHAGVRRCETGFLQCDSCWMDVAREAGFEGEKGPLARWLKSVPRQGFTLLRRMAEWKFGPNYVICTTPLSNVRITSFFAGECEVNVIDPRKLAIEVPRLGQSTYACEQRNRDVHTGRAVHLT